jgi:hypothetical protein
VGWTDLEHIQCASGRATEIECGVSQVWGARSRTSGSVRLVTEKPCCKKGLTTSALQWRNWAREMADMEKQKITGDVSV